MNKKKIALYFSLFLLTLTGLVTINRPLSLKRFVDSWFLISGLFTALLLFKRLLDQGGFDTFRYSWYKTKQYVLFFLPKYWKNKEMGYDDSYKEQTKIENIYDYVAYRHERAWKKLPILLATVLTHLLISVILSLLMYYL